MADEVYCVIHTSSDGYTYSAESLMGIFFSKDEAETALLEHVEKVKSLEEARRSRNDAYPALHKALISKTDSAIAEYMAQSKRIDQQYQSAFTALGLTVDDALSVIIDSDLDNWVVRPVEVGKIYFGGA